MEYKLSNFSCPKIEGPYTKESVEKFGINLGNISELEIGCPLQGPNSIEKKLA